jgi:DNA primase
MESFERAKQEIELLDFVQEHVTDRIVRKGSQYFVSCPKSSNGDSDPSLAIYPDQNSFYCYHCGGDFYGSIIDFVKGWKNLDSNLDALRVLNDLYPDLGLLNPAMQQVAEQRARFIDYVTNQAMSAHNLLMSEQYKPYLDALVNSRKLSEETIIRFKLGIKVMNGYPRLTFPQIDNTGKALAIVTRQLVDNDPRPHYHMSNIYIDKQTSELTTKDNPNSITIWEKGSWLYNINQAYTEQPGGMVFIVEGHLDVVAAAEEGISAVACGMKVPTKEQAKLLEPFSEIVISPDKDAEDSVIKTYSILRELFPTKVIKVFTQPEPEIKDFGDLRKSGKLHNGEILNRCVFAEKFFINKYKYNEIVDMLNIMNEPMGRTIAIEALAQAYGVNAMLFSSTLDRMKE